MKLTKQEMFDRAYRGLASQGWKRAADGGRCLYLTDDGRRCAWGWIDPEATASVEAMSIGDVRDLKYERVGLASSLDKEDLNFALDLQQEHDMSTDRTLARNMREFAARHSLAIPELP